MNVGDIRSTTGIPDRKEIVVAVQPQQPGLGGRGKLKSTRNYIKVWGPLHNNYRR